MTKAIQKKESVDLTAEVTPIEAALLENDLSKLTEAERNQYYNQVCESLKLNRLTQPFGYFRLQGKVSLYAKKDCTDQLRKIHGVSIGKPEIQEMQGHFVVSVAAVDKTGRQDSDIGVVKTTDMGGNFGNALMKAVTKAKRRVTLSICGLGITDESEISDIKGAQIFDPADIKSEPLKITSGNSQTELRKAVTDLCGELNRAGDDVQWNPRTLDEFCNDYFSDGEGFKALTDADLERLREELELRLGSVLKAKVEAPAEIEGDVV